MAAAIPKPPPLPLSTMTQLLHLPNVSMVPLGTLLATTRSEGEPLFQKSLSKQSLKKKKAQTTAASDCDSQHSQSSGHLEYDPDEHSESDKFSIPDYVKNPYAALFSDKRQSANYGGANRRKSRRKSDMRRRSSAAWQHLTDEELAEDVQPRPLVPSMYSRDMEIALLDQKKKAFQTGIINGREHRPTDGKTYPILSIGGKPTSPVLQQSQVPTQMLKCEKISKAPSHIIKLASLLCKQRDQQQHHPVQLHKPREDIDWGSSIPLSPDHVPKPPHQPTATPPRDNSDNNALALPAVKTPRKHREEIFSVIGTPVVTRSLAELDLPTSSNTTTTLVMQNKRDSPKALYGSVTDDPADIRSFLPKTSCPPHHQKLLQRSAGLDGIKSPSDGNVSTPSTTMRITTVVMLQHSDGTISVKPNGFRHQILNLKDAFVK